MAAPFARKGSWPVQWLMTLKPGAYFCGAWVAGHSAKQSSPVPRVVQLRIVELRMPTQKFTPSAMVLRKRQPSTTRLLELLTQAPVLVCSTQTREMVEFVPKDSPKLSLGSL